VDTVAGIDGRDEPDKLRMLAAAISAANSRIADLVATDYSLEGMGTTMTAAILDGDAIGLAHIGDSRGYLFTEGRLVQITHDHSWVQSLIDEGKISEEEAAAHPHRSLLLKVLNGQPANEPDLSTVPLQPGDRLLLCSDGLCGFVDAPVIADALTGTSREEAMTRLVKAAHDAGGLDNITIIIADVYDPEQTTPRAAVAADTEEPGDGAVGGPALDATGQQVAGPAGGAQLLGAALERDIPAAEEEIRRRVAERDAEQDSYDLEDEDDFDDDGDPLEPEDEDRYAPQAPSRRRWRRPLILTVVVLLVLAVASAAGYGWTRTQYYVGASGDQVAIYQGLNESVPGVPLSRVYEVQQLRLADLPEYYQGMVRNTINTGTLDSARATVQQLKDTAARCATQQPLPGPTSSAEPSSTPTPTGHATSKSTRKATSKTTSKTTGKASSKATGKAKPSVKSTTGSGRPTVSSSPGGDTSPSATSTSAGQLPGAPRC
jgi:protein phosphatase